MSAASGGGVASRLRGKRFVSAEFLYKPRPTEPRARRVFDFALESRLAELSRYDDAAVLLICDSQATAASFADLPARYPRLTFVSALANPQPVAAPDPYAGTPARSGWPDPAGWRRYAPTDRWARLTFALDAARQIDSPGWLILPANDAVWGRGLIDLLLGISQRFAQNGLPAAVSPYTPFQHSSVPGAGIPPEIVDALNAAFARDSLLRWRLRSGQYQAFWGKMGLIPFGMAAELLRRAETMVWEDDLEIDRAVRAAGDAVRCQWIGDPALYRQALPVFDRAGLRAVVERTLHYSLSIPGETSLISRPLDALARLRVRLDPRFARAVALSESLAAECRAEIDARLRRYGASWVDWGAYRYVARVGDPLVQVWKYGQAML